MAQRSGAETAVPSGAVQRRRCPAERCRDGGACAGGCREVDGCWVGGWLRLCGLEEGVTDTLGEDTGDVYMVVGVVTACVRSVLVGVLVMDVVAEDVVHASVSGDVTEREEGDKEEGDTEEAVAVGMSACGCCLGECLWDVWCLCLDELPLGVEVCAGWSVGVSGIGRGTGEWDWVEEVGGGRQETGTMAAVSAEGRALNDR
ncbi:hypothetical protein NDU88_004634 [Pleurodeles waltl]|uniref:Uncharacterized protein n=1 Tax=Pleurodeles waltl TaxID=8319 RepID=A0AAV7SJC5_PLEWA|nr:hypothetical protein NDU88_004634 [Pleurodeles waltl]